MDERVPGRLQFVQLFVLLEATGRLPPVGDPGRVSGKGLPCVAAVPGAQAVAPSQLCAQARAAVVCGSLSLLRADPLLS